MKVFSERLKEERKIKGYSQHIMADKIGVPYGTYKNYELLGTKSGREPPMEIIVKIAAVLEVHTDYLLGLED